MGPTRRSGVSRHVNRSTGPGSDQRRTMGFGKRREEEEAARATYQLNISGLDDGCQQMLEEARVGPNGQQERMDTGEDNEDGGAEWVDELPTNLQQEDSFAYTLRDIVGSYWRTYKDNRTWRQRVHRVQANWEPALNAMVAAYLIYRYPPTEPTTPSPDDDHDLSFELDTIDIYTLAPTVVISRPHDSQFVAADIVRHGFIGNTPLDPSRAISIHTLELFRRLRMRKPSFSVEAFAKVICDLFMIPYRRRFRTVLGDAFDVYLAILRVVDRQVREALGRDTVNWRVQNACPPCMHKLENEPPMIHGRKAAFDGNNSMKRLYQLGERHIRDPRPFLDSDYLLSPQYVGQFKDEVGNTSKAPNIGTNEEEGGVDDEAQSSESFEKQCAECTNNFKSAHQEGKTMWGVFEETGWFVSACRHSLVMWFSDMLRTGEQAKYPLAHIAKGMEVEEDRTLWGSDIGCLLQVTVGNSSLGPLFQSRGNKLVVNAFHGYAHNWACQKKNHPNVIEGIGLEDFETLERLFSASNAVASVTRYSTAFRRRIFIDLFLRQWDDDKYLNLADFLYHNYVQALRIIESDKLAYDQTMTMLGLTEADIEQFEAEETAHFSKPDSEPLWDTHTVVYVELLQDLRVAESAMQSRNTAFLSTVPSDYHYVAASDTGPVDYNGDLSQTRKAETRRRVALEHYSQLVNDVTGMEVKMAIDVRWMPGDIQYCETLQYISERKYHQALGHLQRLVVQRLFELNKLNVAGTAYRMRTHIAKSLQTRCKAIQNAVNSYNKAAMELTPPRPSLDWTKASHYAFLEDFELLRDTRHDIRAQPWTDPVVRTAMKQCQRIKRAREEIFNCNIEVPRLHTHVLQESAQLLDRVGSLQAEGSLIAGAVGEFVVRRRRANAHILGRIQLIHELEGYTGSKEPGVRVGHSTTVPQNRDQDQAESAIVDGDADEDVDDLDDDDEAQGDYGGLITFLSELSL